MDVSLPASLSVILVACQSTASPGGYNQTIASTFITAQGPYDQPVFITEHPGMSRLSRLSRPLQCFHILQQHSPSFTFLVQVMISSKCPTLLVQLKQLVACKKKIISDLWQSFGDYNFHIVNINSWISYKTKLGTN